MATSSPLASLSPSLQNIKQKSPLRIVPHQSLDLEDLPTKPPRPSRPFTMSTVSNYDASDNDESQDTSPTTPATPAGSAFRKHSSSTAPSPLESPISIKKPPINDVVESIQSSPSRPTLWVNDSSPGAGVTQEMQENNMLDGQMHGDDEGLSTIIHEGIRGSEDSAADITDITLGMDDSTNDVSAFSAIPDADLTRFTTVRGVAIATPTKSDTIGWSPSKQLSDSGAAAPGTVKRELQLPAHGFDDEATPRRPLSGSPTEDLLNFTGQSHIVMPPPRSSSRPSMRRSPTGRGSFPIRVNPSPTHRSQASVDREKSLGIISPVKQERSTPIGDRRANLLDFDLEPLSTPRSIPSITPRELESLRSDLSSQISSLSATLSGKEAEVLALKRAITATEVRVGHTSEELRNEKLLREAIEQEKQDWGRRGREMETVLREIRQEIMVGEHERDKLRRQTEEAEKRADEMEVRVVELQTRLDSANRRATRSPTSSPTKGTRGSGEPVTPLMSGANGGEGLGTDINEAVREATERVARDLHGLYRSKHETKVAALKKSYEARWEKKVHHLENELKSLNSEMTDMKTQLDQSSAADVGHHQQELQYGQESGEEQKQFREQLAKEKELAEAEKKMLVARLEGMESEMQSVRQESSGLRDQVAKERVEKGELVAQVDLFLALGDSQPPAATIGSSSSSIYRNSHRTAATEPRLRSISTDSIISPSRHNSSSSSSTTTTTTTPATQHSRPQIHRQHQSHQSYNSPVRSNPATPSRRGTTGGGGGAGAGAGGGRPRPMSMLQPPGKFSGIPGPGGKAMPARHGVGAAAAAGGGGGRIMEGIARMGATGGVGGGGGGGNR